MAVDSIYMLQKLNRNYSIGLLSILNMEGTTGVKIYKGKNFIRIS